MEILAWVAGIVLLFGLYKLYVYLKARNTAKSGGGSGGGVGGRPGTTRPK